MKKLAVLVLVLAAGAALARVPVAEEFEAKWLLPGLLDGPPTFAESTHDYNARFYRVDLDLPMTSGAMDAHAGICVMMEVPDLDSILLDFRGLECDSAKLGGTTLGFSETSTALSVYLDETVPVGDSVYIDIWYHRNSGTQNRGFYYYLKGSGNNRNHSVCYSITEPEDSRYWFPCWDKPWDKAERGCQVNITVPDSFSTCANGLLDSVTSGGGKKTYWWTHRYAIPTYLMNFNASIFSEWSHWYHYSPTDSMEIGYWIWPEDSTESVESFENVVAMMEFFADSSRFGSYPFIEEKYGQVAVYPFSFGGMEHQTMTTIHRNWVTRGSEGGIAHELAHMWYGDYVTCHDWREIWLNEGGASYLDPLYMRSMYGESRFLADMQDYRQYFFQADQQDRHPIYDPGLARLFDYGHTYCKSAWVNHMLRYVEADTVFESPGIWWETERVYLDSFALGTSTTEDKKRIHEQETGLELDWFFEDWVFMAGFPNYTVNWYGRETIDGWEVVLDVAQNNGAQTPDYFQIPVEIMVNCVGSDTLFRFPITANPQREVFEVSGQPAGITFNPGKWILEKHSITSGIENAIDPTAKVGRPTLHAIAPNPVGGRARIRFSLPNARTARLAVYDATGREVAVLHSGRADAGQHSVNWDSGALAAGVYLVRLESGREVDVQKVIVR